MKYIWILTAFGLGPRGYLISALRPADGAMLLFHLDLDHRIREMRHGSRIAGVTVWTYTQFCELDSVDRAAIRAICDEYPITEVQDNSPGPVK
jgi:hypothetical protein